jgi:thioredoxin 2
MPTVTCPNCDSKNRVPPERDTGKGKCGKCHAPLFAGKPLVLSTARFRNHLEGSDVPLLVDFWAPWFGPCPMVRTLPHDGAGVRGGSE